MTNRTSALLALFVAVFVVGCSSDSDSGSGPAADAPPTGPRVGFRIASVDVDGDTDGILDRRFELVYDDNGLNIGELIDIGFDGGYDNEFDYIYLDGRLTEIRFDRDRDESIDSYEYYAYDADGFLQSRVSRDTPEGPIVGRTDYQLGDDGLLTGATSDGDNDGVVDIYSTYVRNDNGALVRVDIRSAADGDVTGTNVFTYEDDGRIRDAVRTRTDNTATWSYNYETAMCDPANNVEPLGAVCVFVTP